MEDKSNTILSLQNEHSKLHEEIERLQLMIKKQNRIITKNLRQKLETNKLRKKETAYLKVYNLTKCFQTYYSYNNFIQQFENELMLKNQELDQLYDEINCQVSEYFL